MTASPIGRLAAGIACLAASLSAQSPVEPALVRRPAELLFRSDRGGGGDGIYRIASTGGEAEQLVANERAVVEFALDPGGGRVAYVCDPDDTEAFDLRVLELATGKTAVVHHGIRLRPRWSRDGTRLAFMHYRKRWRIRLTNPDVEIARPEQEFVGGDGAPSWLPGDGQVVFQSNRTGALELFVADTATGAATRLTTTARAESSPQVSPDGRLIAFYSGRDVGVVRIDGGGWRVLVAGPCGGLDWAPDSQRLAFHRGDEGARAVFTIGLEPGAKPRQLTKEFGDDSSPTWSPDGSRLAFVSRRDGDAEIYTMAADGGDVQRVTCNGARDRSPQWLPMAAAATRRAPRCP
ncbi:MAG: PD40 domain-containing protein [Planctomycetes bacterium]|nr:PD40 domain-containing protein [Planctomycetota bacterium]